MFDSILVDLESSTEDFGLGLEYICIEVECSEEPFQNGRENAIEGLVLERGEGGEGEVAQDAGCDEGTTSAWGSNSRHQNSVDYLLERFFLVFVLVPSTLIQILP